MWVLKTEKNYQAIKIGKNMASNDLLPRVRKSPVCLSNPKKGRLKGSWSKVRLYIEQDGKI